MSLPSIRYLTTGFVILAFAATQFLLAEVSQAQSEAAKEAAAKAAAAKARSSSAPPQRSTPARATPGSDKTPAAKADSPSSEKASGSSTVRSRKARQVTDADVGQLDMPLGEDGKVAFQIRGQPWEEVLVWLAGVARLNLSMDEVPEDPCTLVTQQRYTVDEAADLLNGLLLSKGFTLLRDREVLYLTKLDGLNSSLVPRVEPEALDGRGRNEMLKVIFPLQSLIATEVQNEVKSLLGTYGKVTALKATNRLEVLGTGRSLRDVRDFLAQEQSSQRQLVREFRLQHTRAEDVVGMLRNLLGIKEKSSEPMTPQQQQQAMQLAQMRAQQRNQGKAVPEEKEPDVHLAVNDRNNSILVSGAPDKVALVEQAVSVIDRPENAPGQEDDGSLAAALRRPQVITYYLSAVSPTLVVKILQGTGELDPRTRLEADTNTHSVIAYATPKDHGTISAFVKEIDATGRHLEVIQLYTLPADMAAGSIEALMKGKPKEEDDSRNRYFGFYSSYGRSNTKEKDPSEEFQIEADVENNRLLLRATEYELAEVKALLAKLGEHPDRAQNTSTLRTLQMAPKDQESLLRAIEQLWPNLSPDSKLNILKPSTVSPSDKPDDGRLPSKNGAGDEKEAEGKNVALRADARGVGTLALGGHVTLAVKDEFGPAPTDSNAPVAAGPRNDVDETPLSAQDAGVAASVPGRSPAAGAGDTAAPLTIIPGPNGLMISSPDPEVLDRLERLVAELRPPQAEFTVFYLKKAYAEDVAYILEDVFKEEDKNDNGNSSFYRWYWGFDPSSGSDKPSLSLSRRKPLKIIADPVTNSLLVRASPDQLAEVRRLIEVLDSPPPSNSETARVLKLIPVYNTTAKEVAAIVEDVFREFLSENDPARGGRGGNKPQVTGRYVTNYNFGSTGGSSSAGKMDNLLSVGVDERNNTLIVSAPKELLAEIEKMVADLDARAKRPNQVIRVLNVPAAGSMKSVQEALNIVVGGEKRRQAEEEAAKQQQPQKEAQQQQQVEAEAVP